MQNISVATIVVEALDASKGIEEFIHQGLEHIDNMKGVTVCTGRNNCSLGKTNGVLAPCRTTLEKNITRDIEAYVAVQVEYRSRALKLQVRSAELKDHVEHELSHHLWGRLARENIVLQAARICGDYFLS